MRSSRACRLRGRVGPQARQRVLEPLAVVVGMHLVSVVAGERLALRQPVVESGQRFDVGDVRVAGVDDGQRPAGVLGTITSCCVPSRAR